MEKKLLKWKPIAEPELFYLRAAQGWIELGNAEEAQREIDKIPKIFRRDPNVMLVWCEIYAKEGKWDDCRKVARKLTKDHPDSEKGWLFLANATRRAPNGSIKEAEKILSSIYMKFLFRPMISYTRACCAGQRGDFEMAAEWLDDAFTSAARDAKVIDEIAALALNEPDLKLIWHRIQKIADFNKTH